MKTAILSTALFLTGALAFPADVNPKMMEAISKAVLQKRVDVPGFNAKAQLVSVSGKHKFVAPNFAAGDERGPCPGLNALANHGYLPHNGVGTALEFLTGTLEGKHKSLRKPPWFSGLICHRCWTRSRHWRFLRHIRRFLCWRRCQMVDWRTT